MKHTYKHINLNDNDEAQYCFFYPLTNKFKSTYYGEMVKVDKSEMTEFNKYWKIVEEENSTSKLVEQYSEATRIIIKDDAQKLVAPFPHINLEIISDPRVFGKDRTSSSMKMNVRQAQIMKDILDAFIKRNT